MRRNRRLKLRPWQDLLSAENHSRRVRLPSPRVRMVVASIESINPGAKREARWPDMTSIQGSRRARLLPPESSTVADVAREWGWHADAGTVARGCVDRAGAGSGLDGGSALGGGDHDSGPGRRPVAASGVAPRGCTRRSWRSGVAAATEALADAGGSPGESAADARGPARIKELERELRRKDKALAETAALLVLSKKVAAIFHKGADE